MIIGNSISPLSTIIYAAGGISYIPLLDTYANSKSCWSVFKMRTTFTGSFGTMRLDADDSTALLPYNLQGTPDLDALTLFANGGLVTLKIWNGQDLAETPLAQSVTGSQPSLTDGSGNPLLENGILAPDFDGINDVMEVPSSQSTFRFMHDGDNSSTFTVAKFGNSLNPDQAYVFLGNNAGSSDKTGVTLSYNDRASSSESNALNNVISNGAANACFNKNNDVVTPNTQQIISVLMDADNSTLIDRSRVFVNDGSVIQSNTSSATPSTSNATHNLQVGANGNGGNNLEGSIQEITIFEDNYLTEQSDIVTQINSRFNTFV
tara:strand:+ start:1777 stop:2736 length:960 start_codon:yes stop_codon:yes gene_type:complete